MTKKVIQINKNPVYDIGMITTVFSKDTEFFGDLSFKKSLQINGYFEGEIVSGGFLVVGEGAVVRQRQTVPAEHIAVGVPARVLDRPVDDAYRAEFGSLSESQVDGLDFLLTRLETDPPASLEHAAYLLATTYHECAATWHPVAEAYWITPDAEAWREANLDYYPWYGRGYVMITWESNYINAGNELGQDFTTDPYVVMERENSYAILLRGCAEGWFTGKKLSDYIKAHAEKNGYELVLDISGMTRNFIPAIV